MGMGAEARNSADQLIFSETSYSGNFRGSFNTTGAQSGTITDPDLIGRRLFHFAPQNISLYGGPNLTLDPNNGQITWTYEITAAGQSAPPPPVETIFYGGY